MLKAQYNLANMYANGQGVWQEFTKARAWWAKAAAQGDEDATKALKR
jgi:TPR repeat protein